MVPLLVWTRVNTTLEDFVTLWLIRPVRGCALGPLEASALGGKTFSPEGKVSKLDQRLRLRGYKIRGRV